MTVVVDALLTSGAFTTVTAAAVIATRFAVTLGYAATLAVLAALVFGACIAVLPFETSGCRFNAVLHATLVVIALCLVSFATVFVGDA